MYIDANAQVAGVKMSKTISFSSRWLNSRRPRPTLIVSRSQNGRSQESPRGQISGFNQNHGPNDDGQRTGFCRRDREYLLLRSLRRWRCADPFDWPGRITGRMIIFTNIAAQLQLKTSKKYCKTVRTDDLLYRTRQLLVYQAGHPHIVTVRSQPVVGWVVLS